MRVWQERLDSLCEQLRVSRGVRLCESALVEVPTVIGWLRPVILVPASLFTGLSAPQLEALLAHELAHIRRYDYLVNLIQTAVETLLFYHPAVWWVSAQVREEREHCCDHCVVRQTGNAREYARLLAQLAEPAFGTVAPKPALARAFSAPMAEHQLVHRVRQILGNEESSMKVSRTFFGSLAIGFIGLLAFVGCVLFSLYQLLRRA